jgi:hypothetical protein
VAVEIDGVPQHSVPGFLAGLAQASETLGAVPARLEAGRVHDVAFGKLIDAAKVRDAYHQRLPATAENIAEARLLIDHFIAEFGGTPILTPEERAAAAAGDAAVPAGSDGPESEPAPGEDVAAEGAAAQVTPPQEQLSAAESAPVETPEPAAASAEAEPREATPPEPDPAQRDGVGSAPQPEDAAEPSAPAEPAPVPAPAPASAEATPVEPAPPPASGEPAPAPAPAEVTLADLIPGQAEAPDAESIPNEP